MIANEIKARILAQYLGSVVELDNGGSKVRNRKLIAVGGWDDELYIKLRLGEAGKNQFVHAVFIKEKSFSLCLKPLSSITDEDAIEVAKIMGLKDCVVFTGEGDERIIVEEIDATGIQCWIWHDGDIFVDNSFTNETISNITPVAAYQFLQSKGYALSYMEYFVEDLVSEGIYKLI